MFTVAAPRPSKTCPWQRTRPPPLQRHPITAPEPRLRGSPRLGKGHWPRAPPTRRQPRMRARRRFRCGPPCAPPRDGGPCGRPVVLAGSSGSAATQRLYIRWPSRLVSTMVACPGGRAPPLASAASPPNHLPPRRRAPPNLLQPLPAPATTRRRGPHVLLLCDGQGRRVPMVTWRPSSPAAVTPRPPTAVPGPLVENV